MPSLGGLIIKRNYDFDAVSEVLFKDLQVGTVGGDGFIASFNLLRDYNI